MMIIIGTPTAVLNRLIAAFAPSRSPLHIPLVESWTSLAEQARAAHTLCIIVNLDDPQLDLQVLGPLWLQPLRLPYLIGVTKDKTVGYTAFKNGFSDIHGPGEPVEHVTRRYHRAHPACNGYLYFESGKKKTLFTPKRDSIFKSRQLYNRSLFDFGTDHSFI